MYFFLKSSQAGAMLNMVDQLALIVACLGHDTDHPGLNNAFQEKANTNIGIFKCLF